MTANNQVLNVNDSNKFPALGSQGKSKRKKKQRHKKNKTRSNEAPRGGPLLTTDTSAVTNGNEKKPGSKPSSSPNPFSTTPKFAQNISGLGESGFTDYVTNSNNEDQKLDTPQKGEKTTKPEGKKETETKEISNGATEIENAANANFTWAGQPKNAQKTSKDTHQEPKENEMKKKKERRSKEVSIEEISHVREEELNMAQQQMRQLIDAKAQLEDKVAEQDEIIASKSTTIEQLKQQVSTIKDGSSSLQQQLDTFEAQLKEHETKKGDYTQIEDLESRIATLKNQLIQQRTSSQDRETTLLNNLREANETNQVELNKLNALVDMHRKKAESLEKDLHLEKAGVKNHQQSSQKVVSLQQKVETLQKEKREAESKVHAQVQTFDKQKKVWESKLNKLAQELASVQLHAHEEVKAANAKVQEAQKKLKESATSVDNLTNDKLELQDEITKHVMKIDGLEKSNKELQSSIDAPTSTNSSTGFPLNNQVLFTNYSQGFLLSYILSNHNNKQ